MNYTPRRVIVQGITGTHGAFHTQRMMTYGTNIIGGTSPNMAVQTVHGAPVYPTIAALQQDIGDVDASVIFVPAPFAKDAILEAIEAAIPLIVCITEGIPIHDMLAINQAIASTDSRLLGSNCPGLLTPDDCLLGIIPTHITLPGDVAIVSRSGTLTYETVAALTQAGIGQRYIVGIGGDPISGTSFVDCLQDFMKDDTVKRIVMIGEIGGTTELDAADYIAKHGTKPVTAYIAGHAAPQGVQMGHAGAILTSHDESAQAKTDYLRSKGISTVSTITDITSLLRDTIYP